MVKNGEHFYFYGESVERLAFLTIFTVPQTLSSWSILVSLNLTLPIVLVTRVFELEMLNSVNKETG